jgi:hypothetical protein
MIQIPLLDQNLMVSTVQDVTEKVRTEEELRILRGEVDPDGVIIGK